MHRQLGKNKKKDEMMQSDIEEQLLPVRAVAELLHVKESTIRKWVAQLEIPHLRLGKTIRFRKTEVLQWLEDNAKKGNAN